MTFFAYSPESATGASLRASRLHRLAVWTVLLVVLAAGAPPSAAATTGATAVGAPGTGRGEVPTRVFRPGDYDAHPQCWTMVQDARGLIHVGNTDGLLSFDGARWELRSMDKHGGVTSLCVGPDGAVYVGSTSSLGRLRYDADGRLVHESLLPGLAVEDRPQEEVWYANATSEAVYFATLTSILRVTPDGSVERIDDAPGLDLGGAFFAIEVWQDRLWVAADGRGLFRYDGGRFERRVGPDGGTGEAAFSGEALSDLVAWGDRLVVLNSGRLFVFDGQTLRPLPTEADPVFEKAWSYVGRGLDGGRLAVGTVEAGVVLLDAEGRILRHWREEDGLLPGSVAEFGTDHEGGLWVCQEGGLVRLDLAAPYEVFPEVQGILNDVAKVDGVVYAATSSGFYRLRPGDDDRAHFERLEGGDDFVELLPDPAGLLVATSGGLSRYGDGAWSDAVYLNYPNTVQRARTPSDRLFALTRDGLAFLSTAGDSLAVLGVHALPVEGRSLVDASDGHLWIGSGGGIVLRVRTNTARDAVEELTVFDGEDGLPDSYTRVAEFQDRLVVASAGGLQVCTGDRFWAVPLVGPPSTRFEDALVHDGELWAMVEGRIGKIRPSTRSRRQWNWYELLSGEDHRGRFFSFVPGSDGELWVSQADRLVRIDVEEGAPRRADFTPMLRRVVTSRDSVVWAGAPAPSGIELAFEDNSLRFEFGAASFTGEVPAQYRSRLEGHDERWSNWSSSAYREYTNLREGRYQLRLRARGADGAVSSELAVPVRVRPPWHRSLPARTAFVLLGLVAAIGIVQLLSRIRNRQLRRRNRQLVARVQRRTTELRRANSELLQSNTELERVNEELRRVDDQRSQLLGMAAHDLKNPIGTVRSIAGMLEESVAPGSRDAELVTMVHEVSDRMLALIDGLLTSVAAEAGRIDLDLRSCDAAALARSVVALQRRAANEKRQTLLCRIPSPDHDPLRVLADEGRLREALDNLVSNALKYAPRGSRVEVEVGPGPEETIRFAVRDHGPGLEEEEAAQLFQPFRRLSPRPTGDEHSCGLGLHIVKKIVELHEGRVWVETEPGRGSIFGFDLPAASGPPQGPAPTSSPGDETVSIPESTASP